MSPQDANDPAERPPAKGTSVNMAIAAAWGAAGTAAFYLILALPFIRNTGVHDLFWRSMVQHATCYFFFWGAAGLVLKVLKLRTEQAAFDLDLLPSDSAQLIRQEEALAVIRKIRRLSPWEQSRLLTSRVMRALVRFKLLGSAEKVDDLLKYQADSDAENMESSFGLIKFFIALIPILGFLGTVFGISQAVNGFKDVIAEAAELEGIRDALKGVTVGLAVAFDTTIVALVMSALLMLGLTIVQRAEEQLLGRIEEVCLTDLLAKLWVPPPQELFEVAMKRAIASLPDSLGRAIAEQLRDVTKGPPPGQGQRPVQS